MKHLLLTTIAAVVLVGCGPSEADKALLYAASKGHIEAVKQHLAAGTDVNAKHDNGVTPLHGAVTFGHNEIVELLIAEGADVNAKGVGGTTPLDWAVDSAHSDQETADLLRKHGGKTGDWLDADKSIHKAARAGHIEAVKQHLAAGADVNGKEEWGWTPLHFTTTKEIAELLIGNGADVNAKNDGGFTPLHYAASRRDKEIAELLIAKDADVNAKMEDGDTPLDWAIEINRTETAALLRKHGGKTGEELKAEGK